MTSYIFNESMRKKIECNCRVKQVLESSSISLQYPQTINFVIFHTTNADLMSTYL